MTSAARLKANRQNARRSTGPRTRAGKARVARNALRHGLAVPVDRLPEYSERLDRLATLIAGTGADGERLALAQHVAEAEIEILRARQARVTALRRPPVRSNSLDCNPLPIPPPSSELQRIDRYERRAMSRRKKAIRALDALSDAK